MDGAAFTSYWQQPDSNPERFTHIINALDATLNPRVSNDVRQQALQHLEQVKTQPDAPHCGFLLAEDWKQTDAVRYYGLQLLEYAVRYRWMDYTPTQTEQLRDWVKCLVGSMREEDAMYIRTKAAQLWAEVAKRCWAEAWMDMDASLVSLWEKPIEEKGMVNKILVLYIMETLSEDIVNGEDTVADLRLDELGDALNEIMVPAELYQELYHARNYGDVLRNGNEGWLSRMCGFLSLCVKQARSETSPEKVKVLTTCAIKALNALRSAAMWINLKAVVEVNCADCLFLPFHTDNVALCIAATEVLYSIFSRPYTQNWHDSWLGLVQQALHPDKVALIRQTFEKAHSAPGEDDERYTLQKKLSELLSVLSSAITLQPTLAASDNNSGMPSFFDMLQRVLQNPSLTVSIPVLHSFTRLLSVEDKTVVDLVFSTFGPLIESCSARLLKYESLPEDSEDQTAQFLFEDFDTMPERHAFLGNYRRYCVSVIQAITRTRPQEALSHVLGQMRTLLETGPYTGGRGFNSAEYSKNGLPILQFDAQAQVVISALKGLQSWLADISDAPPEDEVHARAEQDRANVTNFLRQWCSSVISTHTDDPEVAAHVLQTLVTILQTIRPEPDFVLQVVQHLLTMRLYDNPAHTTFSEAVKSFESLRVLELQKLALAFSNELLEVYHEMEPRIGVLAQKHQDEPRLLWGYRAFLFMIILRASGIDDQPRLARLQTMLKPVHDAWQDDMLTTQLASFENFCAALGMGNLAEFYKAYGFDRTADWSAIQLDSAGQSRQSEIKRKMEELPLRMTKALLAVSTEKLKAGSNASETATALWSPLIPIILPNLLHLLRHAQAFHSMANWSQLPNELQVVVKRTLQDRFWQSGISNESKDEFYARISGSKTSYEGFASVVRGTMRNIREQGYHVLYLLGKFDEQFFGLSDLAAPLAEALFADAGCLAATHLHPIINLSTGMVTQCPPHHRARFLPPLLTQLFDKLDRKISGEWEAISNTSQINREDEALGDEMRTESVLRQLTYSMVSFVTFLLHFDRPRSHINGHSPSKPALRDIVLSDPAVLEPLILFCTHALRVRDTRCCVTICKVFRGMIPLFVSNEDPAPQVREFMATEVLKACITSLNEPYFAEMQKDLALLIAQIILFYSPRSDTPRAVLLSLPNMAAPKVEKIISKICKSQNERQQRALVLDLLEGVRGVSIYEQGKIAREQKRSSKSNVQQQYMEVEKTPTIVNGDEIGLEAVPGLFGGG